MTKFQSAFSGLLFLKIASLSANIITWLIVWLKIRPTSELIPLHYNVFSGTDVVGKGYYLYLLPATGLAILLLNEFFFRFAKRRDNFAAGILVGITLCAQIIILIAVLRLRSQLLF